MLESSANSKSFGLTLLRRSAYNEWRMKKDRKDESAKNTFAQEIENDDKKKEKSNHWFYDRHIGGLLRVFVQLR